MKMSPLSNIIVYRVQEDHPIDMVELLGKLEELPAGDPAQGQKSRSGFAPPVGGYKGLYADLTNGKQRQVLLCLETRDRLIPGPVLADALAKRVAEFEKRAGRLPGTGEKKELKVEVIASLLEKAFIVRKRTRVLVRPTSIYIEASSPKRAELVTGAIRKVLGSLASYPLRVVEDPSVMMTEWVTGKTAPKPLLLGQNVTAKGSVNTKAVSFKNQELEDALIREVVGEAYFVSALGVCSQSLDYSSNTYFTLTDNLVFKGIKWPAMIADMVREEVGEDDDVYTFACATYRIAFSVIDEMVRDVAIAMRGEHFVNGDGDPEIRHADLDYMDLARAAQQVCPPGYTMTIKPGADGQDEDELI